MNAAVKNSLTNGVDQKVGNTLYRGKNPEFLPIYNSLGMITGHRQVTKGIPFVRIR